MHSSRYVAERNVNGMGGMCVNGRWIMISYIQYIGRSAFWFFISFACWSFSCSAFWVFSCSAFWSFSSSAFWTEAEGVPSQGGRGDAPLRRMPPYLTSPDLRDFSENIRGMVTRDVKTDEAECIRYVGFIWSLVPLSELRSNAVVSFINDIWTNYSNLSQVFFLKPLKMSSSKWTSKLLSLREWVVLNEIRNY